ncbi:mitochondrial DNA-directed RNA polymerase [Coccidioides immitis RS]|uniref:DNA-directed RNA polymerase n=2 Tax=Coccidioides immitis TaxID=5501 RepID=J3KGN2_COCIM|nr:mitochondrial DNA-directed RNA polymerase [Coccidioides immitis RS]EAS34917.3 mitochondrial DNA-directed RNA polymerase [Coccidioides immitis RS]KMP00109.1 DNA-directed RNA polymerase [Coccidioides immitis RMSCC 2394]TPX26775.1 DNA-directed RNA polymerase [Coccidioides immitis]
MLSRAAHRKHAFYSLQRSCKQLTLPWLYPALARCESASARTPSIGPPSKTSFPVPPPRVTALQSFRAFATATSDVYVPFEGLESYHKLEPYNKLGSETSFTTPLQTPLPFSDPSDPTEQDASPLIVIRDYLATRPKALRREKSIGGDTNEMLANLDVSLTVGMFDRAAQLVHRLSTLYPHGSPEIVDLHNKYIRMMVSHMILNRRPSLVWDVQKWFEVQMLQLAKVEPDATTYALMLRMTLRMLLGPRRDRSVRRYWKMAKEANVEEEVLGLPVLSEADLGLLSEICSSDFQGAALGDVSELPDSTPPKPSELVSPLEDLPAMPEVRATLQKGFGLTSLKETLSLFNQSKTTTEPEAVSSESIRERQLRLEQDSVIAAMERWRKESAQRNSRPSNPTGGDKLGGVLWDWHQSLLTSIEGEIQSILKAQEKKRKTSEDNDRCEYAPFMNSIGPDRLAAITILATMNALGKTGMNKGIRLTRLIMLLGRAVQEEYVTDRIQETPSKSAPLDSGRRAKLVQDLIPSNRGRKGVRESLIEKYNEIHEPIKWSAAVEAKIGSLLASMLFSSTKVVVKQQNTETGEITFVKQPAFRHVYQLEKGHSVGFVHIHDSVVDRFRREPASSLLAKHLPMVSPPQPWTSYRYGGFLNQPTIIMRARSNDSQCLQRQYVRAAASRGDLDEIFAGLNVLGKTGWRINKPVFDVMLEAWNSGDELADIAPVDPNLPEPTKPETDDPVQLRAYYRSKTLVDNKRSGLHSQRCFQNLQLEIARAYVGETFYLPHNMDFRGRAYPLPPYFNQMGPDMCRGLLLFSKGRELGERGLRWLKIHIANVYGYDKASFDERAQFAMDHLDDVIDSAEKGLNGRRWWLEASDPFQCLAACIELKNALACPDPTKYISHLPIHQDGSCNGLQHYAALGGDIIGARQVNLEPSDRPSDIYSAVADHVRQSIAQEAAAGNQLAKILEDKVNRKIVKQTVMTNVYGVTFLGAIRQVQKQLNAFFPELSERNVVGKCATYITRKIFAALSSMFTGAHEIQFWLGDCANRITQSLGPEQIEALEAARHVPISGTSKAKKKAIIDDLSKRFLSTVIWTTPLKLPVVQPYREAKTRRVVTTLQTLSIKDPHSSDVVNRRKQLQAFPPNFIHSLDATHMMLSAIKCDELGLSFSAVHDSFWTHAGDIDTMNRVLRDAFVRMHSEDIVGRLASEFKARYSKHVYLAKLRPKSTVAQKISAWRKQNGKGKSREHQTDELLLEYKRLQLLRSTDELERIKGEAMVTPGSIFASCQNAEESLVSVQSLGVAAMGHISPEDEAASVDSMLDAEEDSNSSSEMFTADDPLDTAAEGPEEPSFKSERKKTSAAVWVWLPVTFRPIPSKGEFDVKRLKNSQYFFS